MIRDRRKELGLELVFVADLLGLSTKELFEYEHSKVEDVPLDVLEKLAKAYGVEVSDFNEDNRTQDEKEIAKLKLLGKIFNEKRVDLLWQVNLVKTPF